MRPFPLRMQYDSMLCGVTCLQMICEYYGKHYTLDALNQYCHATKEGISLYGISEAANALGLHTISGRVSIDMLSNAPLPCILHWNQNHYVVLYRIKRHKYYVADPSKGKIVYEKEELKDHWISTSSNDEEKGIGMFIQTTPKFYQNKNIQEKRKLSLRFLYGYARQYHRYFSQIIIGSLVASVLQLILPFLTQSIVDIGINYKNLNFIYLVLIAQLMLTLSRTAIDFLRRQLLLHISMRINISLISDFFIKLLCLPMSFFDTKHFGDLIQRMKDHERVEHFLTTQALNVIFSLFNFIIFGIILCIYSRLIFIIFLTGSAIYGGWTSLFLQKRKVLDYRYFEQQAICNSKTYQFISSIQEIKLQDCEQRRRWEWEDVKADMFDIGMHSLRLQQLQEAGSIFITELKNIVITIVAAMAVISGQMTLGMMLAIQYIIGQLNVPIDQLMNFAYAIQDVQLSLERINEIHLKQDELNICGARRELLSSDAGIDLININFKYDIHRPDYILNDITISIPSGKVTAIVGASGSGKSTIIKLMLGYYTPVNGKIMIGKADLAEYDPRWWRRQCGVVMQDGVIFSESIARNIAVDDGDIDPIRLENAAKTACIDKYITSLPLKYDTVIGQDGIGLSMGQRQRILIARAVYRNPSFIFLDEATNSLDATNERVIVENLKHFYHGRTVVIVAHRLSTVRDADNIIVLDSGRIVEQGNHNLLVAHKSTYYNLVKNQLELGV